MMKRFTLIELLVVIAIIAILATLLLPALNKARVRATSAKCIGQLKQAGMAYAMYAQDYRGFYPATWVDKYYSWYLSRYCGEPEVEYPRTFRCPGWKMKYGANPVISYTVSYVKRGSVTLAYNEFYLPERYVSKPGRTIVIFDAKPKSAGSNYTNSGGTIDANADKRHDEKSINALFYDGAAKRAPQLSTWWSEYINN